MSNSISYTFSAPSGSTFVVTIGSTPQGVTAQDGQTYQGYAITGITGTFNGAQIVSLITGGGASGTDPSVGTYDNTIFVNATQGDNGVSFDGIDDEGIGFLDNGGTAYRVAYVNGAFQYTTAGITTPAVLAASTEPNVVCFAAGTLIRTPQGEVPVERLEAGDLVVTAAGEHRPIVWIGHRTIACGRGDREATMPVRLCAGAFGPGRPSRDLLLSPGHAVCVDVVDEVLIPVSCLINGATITQDATETVTYWHVELESHDIIIADNLPAESYLDVGNRGFFEGAAPVEAGCVPDPCKALSTSSDYCRPAYSAGALVDAVRAQLRRRAMMLGWTIDGAPLGDLHVVADGKRIAPAVRGLSACFLLPGGVREVSLVCAATRPRDIGSGGDGRPLGACIAGLAIDDWFSDARRVALDDPHLTAGFYPLEDGQRRWTDGCARFGAELWAGCDTGFVLRVDLACPTVPRWVAPDQGLQQEARAAA